MKIVMKRISTYLWGLMMVIVAEDLPAHEREKLERIALDNGILRVELTPNIGGRILSVQLNGEPNFLLLDDLVDTEPNPAVTPTASHIPYLGHEVWVGPQSEWWTNQIVNEKRRMEKSVWPPDPYLVLAKNALVEKNPQQVIFQGVNSPVSGVSMKKTYSLIEGNPNQITLDVEVKNNRDTEVAWDIWYNTRVPHTTHVYVPIADASDAGVQHMADATYDGLEYQFANGFFSVEHFNSAEKEGRKGKIFIQPKSGWFAAFRGKQVLIIEFPLQPREKIHHEQGQVELYQEFLNADLDAGVLELEVHFPYEKLKPGETMRAQERWTLLPYQGAATRAAHVEFLQDYERKVNSQ